MRKSLVPNVDAVALGGKYLWALPSHPGTKRNFRYLAWIEVEAVAKTDKRIQVRFDYDGKSYTRTVSTARLIALD
jgi:hypothetical protein